MNEIEQFQFAIMKNFVITGEVGSLEKWFLECNFTREKEQRLFDILDEFSAKSDFSYHEFEHRMKDEFGWSYQAVKCLINSLHQDNRWTDVVYNFLKDMQTTMGNNLSSEYKWIAKELNLIQ